MSARLNNARRISNPTPTWIEQQMRNDPLHVVLNGVDVITIQSFPLAEPAVLCPEGAPPETHAVHQQILQPFRKSVHRFHFRPVHSGTGTEYWPVPRLNGLHRLNQVFAHAFSYVLTRLESVGVVVANVDFGHVSVGVVPGHDDRERFVFPRFEFQTGRGCSVKTSLRGGLGAAHITCGDKRGQGFVDNETFSTTMQFPRSKLTAAIFGIPEETCLGEEPTSVPSIGI